MMGSNGWLPPCWFLATLAMLNLVPHGLAFPKPFRFFTEEPFTLLVTGTRRAVIDSELEFEARLYNGTTPPDIHSPLIYIWSTDACKISQEPCSHETYGTTSSKLRINITQYDVRHAAQYVMRVNVVDLSRVEMGLATGSCYFVLTDTLNGKVQVIQHTGTAVNRPDHVFSTAVPVFLNVTLSDRLAGLQLYNSTWTVTGATNYSSQTHRTWTKLLVQDSGNYKVFAEISALLRVKDKHHIVHEVWRKNIFETEATFEDPISGMIFEGNKTYIVGQNLTGSLVCNGSPPFFFNVTLTDPYNRTLLQAEVESAHCDFSVRRNNLSSAGIYLLDYQITNAVGMEKATTGIDVKVLPSPSRVSDLVPIFAVIIGLVAPSIMIYVYIKEHHGKHSIESANFSFRPSVFERDTYINIKAKLKKLKWTRFFRKKKKKIRYKEMLAAASSVSASDLEPSTSPTSDTSGQSGTSKVTTAASRCGALWNGSRSGSSIPWLEQSSENSGHDQYSSMWLLQSPLSPNVETSFESSTESGTSVRPTQAAYTETSANMHANYGSISFT